MFAALAVSLLALSASVSAGDPVPVSVMETGGTPRVLVYTRTVGFRHDSIPTAIEVLGEKGPSFGVSFNFTEDPGMFNFDNLKLYDGVMFVSTSGEVLEHEGQEALARFFRSGGSYVGVHLASGCLEKDRNYFGVVGATFNYHPFLQPATFTRTNTTHPATVGLPDRWTYAEEVYFLNNDPREQGANVILTVDKASFENPGHSDGDDPWMGPDHPIAWYMESPRTAQPLEKNVTKSGRSFYTSLGHLNETWHDDLFIEHVFGGLTWTLDGGSTRAYNAGIVGNQSVWVPPKPKKANTTNINGTFNGTGPNPNSAVDAKSDATARTGASAAAGVAAVIFGGLLAAVL